MALFLSRSKNSSSQSDEELIAAYKRTGDNALVGELFKRYAHLVFGVCMKYLKKEDEAQDMTMVVFEKLLNDLKVHEVQHFKSWLYMVAKNQCLMLLRKQKGHETVEFQVNTGDDDEEGSMEKGAIGHLEDVDLKEMQLQQIEAGLTTLNHEQKICVELFYLKDKSYVEVAEITGFSLNQVKSYIQNGKRNLKIYLEKRNV